MQESTTQAQCLGKQGFNTKHLASQVAQTSNRHRDRALNTYRCPTCRRWHVGTASRTKP